jgi:hypothetical protein
MELLLLVSDQIWVGIIINFPDLSDQNLRLSNDVALLPRHGLKRVDFLMGASHLVDLWSKSSSAVPDSCFCLSSLLVVLENLFPFEGL